MANDSRADKEEDRRDLLSALSTRLKSAVTVFSSAAAVSAFLLFAGFLSDFAAYRIAGLPRLNFSVTAAAETGAEVLVDSFALLGSGLRLPALLALILGLLAVWAAHKRPAVNRFARSLHLYRAIRLALLVLALLIFGSMVDRAQRSLNSDLLSPTTVDRALRTAYTSSFPDPLARQMHLEEPSYQLRLYELPNWLSKLEQSGRQALDGLASRLGIHVVTAQSRYEQGIALRMLPESRNAAQRIFGWLTLSILALAVSIILCEWWARWLNTDTESQDNAEHSTTHNLPKLSEQEPPAGTATASRSAFKDKLHAFKATFLGEGLASPIERFAVPVTTLLTMLSIGLLPLAHGLLARPSLGGETVMVYLSDTHAPVSAPVPPGDASRPKPSDQRPGRFQCDASALMRIQETRLQLEHTARDIIQSREQRQLRQETARYASISSALADRVIQANCAEAVRSFWLGRPSAGLAAGSLEVAEAYRRSLLKVANAYNVRVGRILNYPRDGQPVVLVDNIIPRNTMQGGLSTIIGLEAKSIGETLVLANTAQRLDELVLRISRNPDDSRTLQALLVYPTADALDATLQLLDVRRLHANAAGVAVTALGGMAWASAADRPDLVVKAIDYLATLASAQPQVGHPDKDNDIRSTAVTALHLTRSPYAAYKFAQMLQSESQEPCNTANDRRVRCLGTSVTTAGYLAGDLTEEERRFPGGKPPARLTQVKETLLDYLVDSMSSQTVKDDFRGAACTGLAKLGYTTLSAATRAKLWEELQRRPKQEMQFSTPVCISIMPVMGLTSTEQRAFLKKIVLSPVTSTTDPTYAERLSVSALTALFEIGLRSEADFMFKAYTESTGKVNRIVSNLLDAVDAEPMAAKLLACASAAETPEPRRVDCINGFSRLHESFDGDDGTSAAVLHIATTSSGAIRASACRVLAIFAERDGKWVLRRRGEDPAVDACLSARTPPSGSEAPTGPDSADAAALLRELLEQHQKPRPAQVPEREQSGA